MNECSTGVETALERQFKSVSMRDEHAVEFNDPLWANWVRPNWLALVIYDRGRIWIERTIDGAVLRYDLRSLHGFVFCLGGATFLGTFGLIGAGVEQGLKFGAGAFIWLYGMNILLAIIRVPLLFRRAVRSI